MSSFSQFSIIRPYIIVLILVIWLPLQIVSICPEKESLVTSLPGFADSDLPCMYSGFIPVDEKTNAQIFYWLILSPNADDKTPLVVWLNGGPGSSSLFGLFTEMGPLREKTTGEFYIEKERTWTSKAHVVYVDQPVGTGYSFADKFDAIPKGEVSVASQFYRFIQRFFIAHNELQSKNFYLIGESYAGKFIPSMANLILEENNKISKGSSHNQVINLKKIAIGNGLFDSRYQRAARKDLAKGVNILSEFDDEPQYDTLVKNCEFSLSQNNTDSLGKCDEILDFVMDLAGDVFRFDIRKSSGYDNSLDSSLNDYLNKEEVVKSLHVSDTTIKSSPYWSLKNDTVKSAMKDDINLISSIPMLEKILNDFDIPIVLYAGQFDLVSGPQGIERALNSMAWKEISGWKSAPRELWKIKATGDEYVVAGYVKQWKNLISITMRNAGHFAPRDRPETSLNILDHLFSDEKSWKCPDDECSLYEKKCKAMSHCSGNGVCGQETGGKCVCKNEFYGPDCSIRSDLLLSNKIINMSPRDTKIFNLTHYDSDVLLEIDSDDQNVLVSLVHKDDHLYIFNQREHMITYRLINHKLLLFVEKAKFADYLVVITNLEFLHEIELKLFVNSYSKNRLY